MQNIDSEPEITVDGEKLGHGQEKALKVGAKINLGGKAEYQVCRYLELYDTMLSISQCPRQLALCVVHIYHALRTPAGRHLDKLHKIGKVSESVCHVQVLRNVRTHA